MGDGQEFLAEIRGEDGSSTPIFEVEQWSGDFQYFPPLFLFEPGEMVLGDTDVFRTTCTWMNTESRSLVSPEEMCTTVGIAYPMADPLFCAGNPNEAAR